jgi:hypothetical protein
MNQSTQSPPGNLQPLLFDDQHNCFGCGAHNRIGMRLRFLFDPKDAWQNASRARTDLCMAAYSPRCSTKP